jgi:hypothetical protein
LRGRNLEALLDRGALDSTLLIRNQIYRNGRYEAISGNDEFARKQSQLDKICLRFIFRFSK